MVTGTSIAKQSIRILGYVNDSMQTVDNEADDDIIKALYSMHKLYPACAIITCPVRHDNFFYMSANAQAVFGYTPQHIADRFRELEYYFSQIHQSDIFDLQNCMDFFESFLHDESPAEYNKLRTVFHYRFRNADGKYIYLQDERATLISAGGTVIHYSLIRAMPDEAIFSGTKIEIYKDGEVFKKIAEYKPSSAKNKLSRRENDLVVLIKKGLTTKEIAWQLNISHNTVRNIKSKLFEKYSVNNTIELLNMTG